MKELLRHLALNHRRIDGSGIWPGLWKLLYRDEPLTKIDIDRVTVNEHGHIVRKEDIP